MGDRYALLGLARPRSSWFADVGRWTSSASLPAEFIKCVSAEELRSRAGGARRFSAALLDGGLSSVDRDLLVGLRNAGVAPIIVAEASRAIAWTELGAVAVLPESPTRAEILDALATHAVMVDRLQPAPLAAQAHAPWDRPGDLIAVTGTGGVGTSTTAMAAAQGLAAARRRDRGSAERVLLADLCLRAELAMLHDARDLVPGFPEVVDLHRGQAPGPQRLRPLAFEASERAYDLLLGIRRSVDWAVLRPVAVEAAIAGLRGAWATVVADIDATFEGEAETGSTDVEDRHAMARTVALAADLVLVVGRPGVKWLHATVRVLDDLGRLGVAPERLQSVIVDGPRGPRQRAEIARALADLTSPRVRGTLATPIFLPGRGIEAAVRDAAPLPTSLCAPLASAIAAGLGRGRSVDATLPVPASLAEPVAVTPGELGLAGDGDGMAA